VVIILQADEGNIPKENHFIVLKQRVDGTPSTLCYLFPTTLIKAWVECIEVFGV
jgi:hypothetical protein